ncbi:hypothetical protein BDV26DRAFT_281366 [Aspergillus bertholletiae]|uniref:Uncharacterized protein n=1 Tax=Aspergillus bertholletiae TaxID=1226010 RepID=A0A5N7B8N3_9EURO|nr:hypothetical protein BDV26DRAFT_281366 [Aspergillus bertholletiae]
MAYTRMGVRSGWIEESETTPIVQENIIVTERTRAARRESQRKLPENYRISKRIPTITTIDKPTKTIKTPATRIEELLKLSAQESSRPPTTHNNLVPYWSYEKNSLAAACVFSAITVLGIIFLSVLSVRKIRRSWKRHKLEKQDYAAFKHRIDMNSNDGDSNICFLDEGKSSRESMMYSRDTSPSGGYVVEQTGGSVTRVYRQGNNVSSQTFDSIGASSDKRSPTRENKRALGSKADSHTSSRKGRAGLIPRPIVVVPSPLRHVASQKAIPVMHLASSRTSDSERPPASSTSLQDIEPVINLLISRCIPWQGFLPSELSLNGALYILFPSMHQHLPLRTGRHAFAYTHSMLDSLYQQMNLVDRIGLIFPCLHIEALATMI